MLRSLACDAPGWSECLHCCFSIRLFCRFAHDWELPRWLAASVLVADWITGHKR